MGDVVDFEAERFKRKVEDEGGFDLPLADISALFFEGDTFAVSAQIRNPEEDDLRNPRTVEEQVALIKHMRWVANWMSARWGLSFMEVPEHWDGDRPEFVLAEESEDPE